MPCHKGFVSLARLAAGHNDDSEHHQCDHCSDQGNFLCNPSWIGREIWFGDARFSRLYVARRSKIYVYIYSSSCIHTQPGQACLNVNVYILEIYQKQIYFFLDTHSVSIMCLYNKYCCIYLYI